ncbi:MAG: hypothetical protein JWM53_5144, partial [bacterium]|nr:hypothetical protein [bacterium]
SADAGPVRAGKVGKNEQLPISATGELALFPLPHAAAASRHSVYKSP